LPRASSQQLALKALEPRPAAPLRDLPSPPSITTLRLASLGEPTATANLLVPVLAGLRHPTGISIPFKDLDYDRVESWLVRILELDPQGQYPLLMASQVYSQVPDENKQRQMLDLAYRQFLLEPEPTLALACARHNHGQAQGQRPKPGAALRSRGSTGTPPRRRFPTGPANAHFCARGHGRSRDR